MPARWLDAVGRVRSHRPTNGAWSTELTDAHHVVGSDGDTAVPAHRTGRAARPAGARSTSAATRRCALDRDGRCSTTPTCWSARAPARRRLRAALVVRRRAPDRDGRPGRRAICDWPELPAPIVGHRREHAATAVGRDLRRGHVVHPARPCLTGSIVADRRSTMRRAAARPGGRSQLPERDCRSGGAATSVDGGAVPMTVLRRADLPAGPRPTLLYGYGGFDIPVLPAFSALFATWVAAGGVLAVANLRGGGEFGADWHQAGHAAPQAASCSTTCSPVPRS